MSAKAEVKPVSGLVIRVGCARRCVNIVPDEWLPRSDARIGAIQNPAYRPTGDFLFGDLTSKFNLCGRQVARWGRVILYKRLRKIT